MILCTAQPSERHIDELPHWHYGCLMRNIEMNEGGRITLPVDARRRLGLEGPTEFEVEVDEGQDALILRPVVALRREDAWAYTPEHRTLLERAHRDSREGRVRELTESELEALV